MCVGVICTQLLSLQAVQAHNYGPSGHPYALYAQGSEHVRGVSPDTSAEETLVARVSTLETKQEECLSLLRRIADSLLAGHPSGLDDSPFDNDGFGSPSPYPSRRCV